MSSHKSFSIGKNLSIRWYKNYMRYFFMDRHHLIIEIGRLSICWFRRRSQ